MAAGTGTGSHAAVAAMMAHAYGGMVHDFVVHVAPRCVTEALQDFVGQKRAEQWFQRIIVFVSVRERLVSWCRFVRSPVLMCLYALMWCLFSRFGFRRARRCVCALVAGGFHAPPTVGICVRERSGVLAALDMHEWLGLVVSGDVCAQAVAWVVGYILRDFSVAVYGWMGAVAASALVSAQRQHALCFASCAIWLTPGDAVDNSGMAVVQAQPNCMADRRTAAGGRRRCSRGGAGGGRQAQAQVMRRVTANMVH